MIAQYFKPVYSRLNETRIIMNIRQMVMIAFLQSRAETKYSLGLSTSATNVTVYFNLSYFVNASKSCIN
jgi:hypothetical protein